MIQIIIFATLLFGILLLYNLRKYSKQKHTLEEPFPDKWKKILIEKVAFYNHLDEQTKEKFRKRIQQFLADTSIRGVKDVTVDDTIKLLVASSAIIPVFLFDGWEYPNLTQVLIYEGAVETHQESDPEINGTLLGQVRPFQSKHLLLLSKQSLISGFESMNGKSNVGFHEFAHLIDQLDGNIDGIPKVLMPESLLKPWTELMYAEIEKIQSDQSDINTYALTNHAEFFAVVCEYFFNNPVVFKEKHPQLYSIMEAIFLKKANS